MDTILAIAAVALAVFGLAAIIFVFAKRRKGCCESDNVREKRIKVKDKVPSHYPYCVRLTVAEMTCPRCGFRAENALNAKGNIWAKAYPKEGYILVRMKENLPSTTLQRIVSREGFPLIGIERIR